MLIRDCDSFKCCRQPRQAVRYVKDEQVQVIYNGVDNAVYQVMDAIQSVTSLVSHRMPWLLEWLVE